MLHFWRVIVIVLTLNIFLFYFLLLQAPDELRVQFTPDDAYYYLQLAKNFSIYSVWTFDSGVSVTSGFHPLFAYSLSGIFSILQPGLNTFLNLGVTISSLFAIASVLIFFSWNKNRRNVYFLLFLSLAISSRNFLLNSISITEWSLVVFVASAYCLWFFVRRTAPNAIDSSVLFWIGLLGSTSRSDFGLLPFSILVAAILASKGRSKKDLVFPLSGFLGALAGLLAVFGHNYIFTNEFLQSSARMKSYWAQVRGANYYLGPILIGNILGVRGLSFLVILIGLGIVSRFRAKNNPDSVLQTDTADENALRLFSSGISILGYMLFYSRNGDIQPWYTANLICPLLLTVFAVTEHLSSTIRTSPASPAVLIVFSVLFLSNIKTNIQSIYPITTSIAPWPHQEIMYQAGNYLSQHPLEGKIGAWNAGIIGYYGGGQVVNLDGLVNNNVHDYILNNDLPSYIIDQEIRYIIDFENMITEESRRRLGGYDDEQFLRNLKPIKIFDNGGYYWKFITLYSLD